MGGLQRYIICLVLLKSDVTIVLLGLKPELKSNAQRCGIDALTRGWGMKLSDYLRWRERAPKEKQPKYSSGYLKAWENPTTIKRKISEVGIALDIARSTKESEDFEELRRRQLQLLAELIEGE